MRGPRWFVLTINIIAVIIITIIIIIVTLMNGPIFHNHYHHYSPLSHYHNHYSDNHDHHISDHNDDQVGLNQTMIDITVEPKLINVIKRLLRCEGVKYTTAIIDLQVVMVI